MAVPHTSPPSVQDAGAPRGFTLLEILVSMSILTVISTMIIVNYRRGNDDSALLKDVSLFMANVRLAQEQTAGGREIAHCSVVTGQQCSANADCPDAPTETCEHEVPRGGYVLAVSCPDITRGNTYPLAFNGAVQYGIFAENRSCALTDGAGCFPVVVAAVAPAIGTTDGRVSYVDVSSASYGDTLQEFTQLNQKIEIKNIRLTPRSGLTIQCGSASPWVSASSGVPTANGSIVPADYPIQAAIRFLPPDGRTVQISDNIASGPPISGTSDIDPDNAWVKAEMVFGVVGRPADCRTVTVTEAGVVSQRTDATCNFSG